MEKILKPYTIIPPHLYVKRNADRQLSDIISDMGRPGYVLVSRQMGKTNLLLNAKREFGNGNDKFIYVDLSNIFDNEQSCFQNIIDLAIETNENIYSEAAKIIFKNRKELNDIPPHKQHSNELRTLLKYTNGKLIIILDEIDALTKTNYSDKIFAQIRSVYFSRVNFPELERLTYILSGVVEPTEIIKDPKISPFNIGEKIFLNDFSKDEFLTFLETAKLNNLLDEVIERIFYWTNGNPRMTWDLCSEIENNKTTINSKEQVDNIIQKLYLTSFDKPPIDNIREIVVSDKKIRDAIIEIDYNKGSEVADNIKSKLYLAGIINYEENDIKIKNRIIKSALNLNWLNSVKEQEQGILSIANEFFDKQKYSEAIVAYERFILTDEFPNKESKNLVYYNLGFAFYKNSNFEKALENNSNSNFSFKEYPQLVLRIKNINGLCYFHLDRFEESIENFKFIIENSPKDELYSRALLNFGSACINSENEILKNEAVEIFKKLTIDDNFDKEIISEKSIDELKSISNYNLGLLNTKNEDSSAFYYFGKALETKKVELKPIFYLNLINSTSDSNNKLILLNSLVECIIDNNILPIDNDPEKPLDLNIEKLQEILILAFKINIESFEKLLGYSLKNIFKNEDKIKVIYDITIICLNTNNPDSGINILKYNYKKNSHNINNNIYAYNNLKLLSYFIKAKEEINYSIDYLKYFKIKRLEPIDFYDFDIVAHTIFELTSRKQYQKANDLLILFNTLKHEVSEDLLVNYLLLNHMHLKIQAISGNSLGATIIANSILHDINTKKYKKYKSNLLAEKEIQNIKNNAINFLKAR